YPRPLNGEIGPLAGEVVDRSGFGHPARECAHQGGGGADTKRRVAAVAHPGAGDERAGDNEDGFALLAVEGGIAGGVSLRLLAVFRAEQIGHGRLDQRRSLSTLASRGMAVCLCSPSAQLSTTSSPSPLRVTTPMA